MTVQGPRGSVDIVRDPIYDYIAFTRPSKSGDVTEKEIIDSRWVQRLRHIYQLQCTWFVYPGATHTRFEHALGVMHLAGRFAEHLWDQYADQFGQNKIPEREYVVELFRLAGLLHDLGHGPFGHTLDETYRDLNMHVSQDEPAALTHEDISRYLIIHSEIGKYIKRIERSPNGSFSKSISPEDVCEMIKPLERLTEHWKINFSFIMRGLFSADKLSFLARDAYHCGTREYGTVDGERLIRSSFITEKGFTVHRGALPAIKAFLWSRFFMYENVYYHRTVRSLDLSFAAILGDIVRAVKISDVLSEIDKFYELTDTYLHGNVPLWARDGDTPEKKQIGKVWKGLIERNVIWFAAAETEIYERGRKVRVSAREWKELLSQRAKDTLGSIPYRIDVPFLEIRPENPALQERAMDSVIWVHDPYLRTVSQWAMEDLWGDMPARFVNARIYTQKKHRDKVYKEASRIFDETAGQSTHH